MSTPPMLGPPGAQRPGVAPAPVGPPGLHFSRSDVAIASYTLSGVTRDSTGAPLAGCTVDLFYATGDKQRYGSTVSDANGAYTFTGGDNVSTFFLVEYLDGATPVGGTSRNTLQFT